MILRPVRLRRTQAVALLLVLGSLVTASCDVDREELYRQIFKDRSKATAEEIAEVAGAPRTVARSADGSLLLTYLVSDESDESAGYAYAVAWRLYDPAGKQVAEDASFYDEGKTGEEPGTSFASTNGLYGTFHGVPGGFLREKPGATAGPEDFEFLGADGKRRPLTSGREEVRSRKGDRPLLELPDAAGPSPRVHGLLYRPQTRTLAPLSKDFLRGTGAFGIDADGSAVAVRPVGEGERLEIVRLRDGDERTLKRLKSTGRPFLATGGGRQPFCSSAVLCAPGPSARDVRRRQALDDQGGFP